MTTTLASGVRMAATGVPSDRNPGAGAVSDAESDPPSGTQLRLVGFQSLTKEASKKRSPHATSGLPAGSRTMRTSCTAASSFTSNFLPSSSQPAPFQRLTYRSLALLPGEVLSDQATTGFPSTSSTRSEVSG